MQLALLMIFPTRMPTVMMLSVTQAPLSSHHTQSLTTANDNTDSDLLGSGLHWIMINALEAEALSFANSRFNLVVLAVPFSLLYPSWTNPFQWIAAFRNHLAPQLSLCHFGGTTNFSLSYPPVLPEASSCYPQPLPALIFQDLTHLLRESTFLQRGTAGLLCILAVPDHTWPLPSPWEHLAQVRLVSLSASRRSPKWWEWLSSPGTGCQSSRAPPVPAWGLWTAGTLLHVRLPQTASTGSSTEAWRWAPWGTHTQHLPSTRQLVAELTAGLLPALPPSCMGTSGRTTVANMPAISVHTDTVQGSACRFG